MSITEVFLLFGGLGFFLYGMKLMSEGLEKAAGAKMRSILEFFTQNRFGNRIYRDHTVFECDYGNGGEFR